MTIPILCLEAGHGGPDSGAVGHGRMEKEFTLALCLQLRDYLLKHYHARIIMPRTTDVGMSLQARCDFANSRGAHYYFSWHVNAAARAEANGYEDFIVRSQPSRTAAYQRAVHPFPARVWTDNGRRNRGMKVANFYVLVNTRMPALLVENGFMSNARDVQLLSDRGFRAELVAAVGEGLAGHLNLKSKTKEETPVPENLEEHWAKADIKRAIDLNLMVGYEDETWRPDRPVTRAELAVVARKLEDRIMDLVEKKLQDRGL